MNHIVDMCPLTTFEGELKLLHKADDDDTVTWLESTATTAVMKQEALLMQRNRASTLSVDIM